MLNKLASQVMGNLDVPLAEELITEIAPDEGMFTGDVNHYFQVGYSALRCIKLALLAANRPEPARILDFACGHGRVMRFMRAAFPKAHLTAVDINHAGVEYCVKTFGATPVYAERQPFQVPIPGTYDMIWVGSLLTHLPIEKWEGFLRLFKSCLAPGGLLLFTTQGRQTNYFIQNALVDFHLTEQQNRLLVADYERTGFGYQHYPFATDYGVSLSSVSCVTAVMEQFPALRLVLCQEKGWDYHQDLYVYLHTDEPAFNLPLTQLDRAFLARYEQITIRTSNTGTTVMTEAEWAELKHSMWLYGRFRRSRFVNTMKSIAKYFRPS